MTTLVVQPICETSILRVPRAWMRLPRDWVRAVGFWHLVDAIRAQENVFLYGAPYDIEWTFAKVPTELDQVALRHPCDECREALQQAKLLLEADQAETVAFIQFTQNYVYPVDHIPTEFAATGFIHEADVDLSKEGSG